MPILRHANTLLLSLALLCQCALANADATCDAHLLAPRGLDTIKALIRDDCLGNTNDDAPVMREVTLIRKANPIPGTSRDRQYVVTVRMLKLLQSDAAQKATTLALPPGVSDHPLHAIEVRLAGIIASLEGGRPPQNFDKNDWHVSPQGTIGHTLYDFRQSLLTPVCADTASSACAQATRIAAEAVRTAYLVQGVAQYSHLDDLHDGYVHVSRLLKQWEVYSTETRPQLIHELWVNSRLYEKTKGEGMTSPPDSQVILVHPSVAMEYVHGADKGSRFQPALLIEWAGYNRWTWKDRNSTQMENAWGGSLVSSVSDRAGTTSMGHGFVIHYKHVYSFGVTRHGGDTGIFVSMDVQKLLMNKQEKYQEVIDAFKVLKD